MPLYRLLISLLAAPVLAVLVLRVLRGRESRADLRQRLGRDRPAFAPGARVVWLHGASNGELTAARPLATALLAADPGLHLLVTANTTTARAMVAGWAHPRIAAGLAPLDLRWATGPLLRGLAPRAHLVIENEFWPNRLAACHAARVPVALVAARLSARSARRWARGLRLVRPLLAPVALALPQDAATADRLVALGLPPAALGPALDLKSAVTLRPPPPEAVAGLGFVRTETVLAASTHAGEETQVLAAFLRARAARPGLRLILAPRHPRRAPGIAAAIRAAGLSFATRSAAEAPGAAAVYLADTLGEMALWYAAAGICIIGGSLVPKGGHTPWEPAQFGCALVHGPDMRNAAAAAAILVTAEAAQVVADAEALATTLVWLTPARQAELGARARAALAPADPAGIAALLRDRLGLEHAPAGDAPDG